MDETRRERKKRETRDLLIRTAIRLFTEQGYEQTTGAQIAAAADVATKTFFNYFPSKEHVLFADVERFYGLALEVIADRAPDDTVPQVLRRTYDRVIAHYLTQGPWAENPELKDLYQRLLATVPAVQAKALHVMSDSQRRIADALLKAFPDRLDPISAAAATGAFMGAVQAAGLASLEMYGEAEQEHLASTGRAMDIAMRGLESL
ncbi:TetR/AcrR family transcriptional regulator [Nonomuraea pusilla]|uniref:Transcriptional regulator, TetR family n=1 Tax=Nonomuraea pusilla TaxID=46177 RepID=A0A1H7QB87_9ACTN|nr:TetR family transcriptional regulator [Nonomuraea pusilla]SEL45421.1 transcriptional regulator, TetR family [Nonomuraea pusilla]